MAALTPLDAFVRKHLLAYPLLFETRWDVLVYFYLGYGHGACWEEGRLVAATTRSTERAQRTAFFEDIDARIAKAMGAKHDAESGSLPSALVDHYKRRLIELQAERARRAFQLKNVDTLVFETRTSARRCVSLDEIQDQLSRDYSSIATIPDDVEASFRAGALEVIKEILPALARARERGEDHGLHAWFLAIRKRLDPHFEARRAACTRLAEEIFGKAAPGKPA